jgi:ABC-type dipeptide/oligopeptide/nickel transport system permease component
LEVDVLRYVILRLILLVPLLVGLSLLLFLYTHAMSGDPIAGLVGPNGSPALVKELRHQYGLDRPLVTQYIVWVKGLLHGQFGLSLVAQEQIGPILASRIPATIQLTIAGVLIELILALPAGFLAGVFKGTWIDRLLSTAMLVGLSAPAFWVGTLLILFVTVHNKWLPSGGYVPFSQETGQSLRDTLLPAVTLGLSGAPYLARVTRAVTVATQQEQFVKQARAKGLRWRTITVRYSFRNALLPVLVVIGLNLGSLLGGQVVIETLFSWPGVGQLLVQSAIARDYLMIQAIVLLAAVLYVTVNLLTEVLHARLDPRITL